MNAEERDQLRLIATTEDHLGATIACVKEICELETDEVRKTDLRILKGDLKKQAKRLEQFGRRLHRKARDHERAT